jgi:hypothetical protein
MVSIGIITDCLYIANSDFMLAISEFRSGKPVSFPSSGRDNLCWHQRRFLEADAGA